MRTQSLTMRESLDAASTDEVYAVLIAIEHDDLAEPLRISTDPTERLSIEPLRYGTRSTWQGANPLTEPYVWIGATAVVPADADDSPQDARLVLDALDRAMVDALRSVRDQATAHMAIVLASSPNLVEAEWIDLRLRSCVITAGEVSLSFSREPIELEMFPAMRMRRHLFPGLQ